MSTEIEAIYTLLEAGDLKESLKAFLKISRETEHYKAAIAINSSFLEYENERIAGKDVRGKREDIISRLSEALDKLTPDNNTVTFTKNITIPTNGEFNDFMQTIKTDYDGITISNQMFQTKKILFVCSSPSDKNPLDFGKEFKKIKEALESSTQREQFEILIETGVEADNFLRLLTRHQPHILHITMHASKSQGLYFEGNQGEEQAISPEDLAAIFKITQKKFKPELVVLSACNSLSQAEAIQTFSQQVIGMQDFLPEQVGVLYAEKLYEMLFDGHEVTIAHEAACLTIKMAKINYEGKVPTHEIPLLLMGQIGLMQR